MPEPAPWDDLRRRVEALDPERQVAFALACAEHLVSVEASHRQADLRSSLARGWRVMFGEEDNLSRLVSQMDQREDVDDDEVASVFYALGAVMGSAEDAWRAAMRARDAAYERVPYMKQEAVLRPLATDTGASAVQDELAWQNAAVASLEVDEPLSAIVARLQS